MTLAMCRNRITWYCRPDEGHCFCLWANGYQIGIYWDTGGHSTREYLYEMCPIDCDSGELLCEYALQRASWGQRHFAKSTGLMELAEVGGDTFFINCKVGDRDSD
jgi:hypothetical protein